MDLDTPRRTIVLWGTDSLGLILLVPTGILVTNQTGGHACLQPQVEGCYVPLRTTADGLAAYFADDPWYGGCMCGIDSATADVVDRYLADVDHGQLAFLTVDRTRLPDSHEAWIYVTVAAIPAAHGSLVQGFGEITGILTWPNSD